MMLYVEDQPSENMTLSVAGFEFSIVPDPLAV